MNSNFILRITTINFHRLYLIMDVALGLLQCIVSDNEQNPAFLFKLKEYMLELKKFDRLISSVEFPRVSSGDVSTGSIFYWIQRLLERLQGAGVCSIPYPVQLDELRLDRPRECERWLMCKQQSGEEQGYGVNELDFYNVSR